MEDLRFYARRVDDCKQMKGIAEDCYKATGDNYWEESAKDWERRAKEWGDMAVNQGVFIV